MRKPSHPDSITKSQLATRAQIPPARTAVLNASPPERPFHPELATRAQIPTRLARDQRLAEAVLVAAHAVKIEASVQEAVDRYIAEECLPHEEVQQRSQEASWEGLGGSREEGAPGVGGVVGWEGEEGDLASSEGSSKGKGCVVS